MPRNDDTLNQYDIGWDMCVAFGVDNTGAIQSEPECTRKMNLWDAVHVHVIWCTTLLVKLLKYLKQKLLLLWRTCFLISTIGLTKAQRKNELSDFCDFCNKVMKHALDRTLLQSYFLLGECSALWVSLSYIS